MFQSDESMCRKGILYTEQAIKIIDHLHTVAVLATVTVGRLLAGAVQTVPNLRIPNDLRRGSSATALALLAEVSAPVSRAMSLVGTELAT